MHRISHTLQHMWLFSRFYTFYFISNKWLYCTLKTIKHYTPQNLECKTYKIVHISHKLHLENQVASPLELRKTRKTAKNGEQENNKNLKSEKGLNPNKCCCNVFRFLFDVHEMRFSQLFICTTRIGRRLLSTILKWPVCKCWYLEESATLRIRIPKPCF